jgi:tRNA (guanine37-N1)-methyltransferase
MMRIDVVTIFPEYLAPIDLSLIGKAADAGVVNIQVTDLREFAVDRHRSVDDTPYGGGPGMVMLAEPWGLALDSVRAQLPDVAPYLVIPTPSGRRFDQATAQTLSDRPWVVIACGRYEGIDSRVAAHYRDNPDWAGVGEISIGDYVLAGGEAAALVMIESIVRLLPGVLGNPLSASTDSFAPGPMAATLEGPVFTRPPTWRGREVPEVLLGGNHAEIAAWRQAEAERRTVQMRPDLR